MDQPSRYFPNWATDEAPATDEGTTWHSWTAPATGKYHLSNLGSAENYYRFSIYPGPAPVTGPPVSHESFDPIALTGIILTFDAIGGASYLIRTTAEKASGGPAMLRVSKAKGASPYTFWRQCYPEWDEILANPLADPDEDERISAAHRICASRFPPAIRFATSGFG